MKKILPALICATFFGYMIYNGIVGVADVKLQNQAFIEAWDISFSGEVTALAKVDHDIGVISLGLDSIVGQAQQVADFQEAPFYFLQNGNNAKLVEAGLSEMQIGDELRITQAGDLMHKRGQQLISQRKIFFIQHPPFWKQMDWKAVVEDW